MRSLCTSGSAQGAARKGGPCRDHTAATERLSKELPRYLLAVQDHAKEYQMRTRTPRLLPRPTQSQLARQTSLTESAVCRRLKAPKTAALHVLWETARDLDAVVSWSGNLRPPMEKDEWHETLTKRGIMTSGHDPLTS